MRRPLLSPAPRVSWISALLGSLLSGLPASCLTPCGLVFTEPPEQSSSPPLLHAPPVFLQPRPGRVAPCRRRAVCDLARSVAHPPRPASPPGCPLLVWQMECRAVSPEKSAPITPDPPALIGVSSLCCLTSCVLRTGAGCEWGKPVQPQEDAGTGRGGRAYSSRRPGAAWGSSRMGRSGGQADPLLGSPRERQDRAG